jgi:hypothetical protein
MPAASATRFPVARRAARRPDRLRRCLSRRPAVRPAARPRLADHRPHRLADGRDQDRAPRHAEPSLRAASSTARYRESFGCRWPEAAQAAVRGEAAPAVEARALGSRMTVHRQRPFACALVLALPRCRPPPAAAGAAVDPPGGAAACRRTPDWSRTLERIAGSVVAIKIDQTRAFDTEWNARRRPPASSWTPSAA